MYKTRDKMWRRENTELYADIGGSESGVGEEWERKRSGHGLG